MKQKEELEDLALQTISKCFQAPIEYICSLRIDYVDFLHYMQTLSNPYNCNITLDSAVELYNNGYYVIE